LNQLRHAVSWQLKRIGRLGEAAGFDDANEGTNGSELVHGSSIVTFMGTMMDDTAVYQAPR
jgi:hypothetical protein